MWYNLNESEFMLKIKYNQKNNKLPHYVLFFMACYVIWQMGIIWLDANNSVISSAGNLSTNFMSNLSSLCVLVSALTIPFIAIKPKYAYKTCKLATFISLFTTILLLANVFTEGCLYILVASCSVMSISSLAIYFYTYSSSNLKKQIVIEMLGVAIISLIFHNGLVALPFMIYNIVSFILLLLFIIGLSKIMDLEITFKKDKKQNNKALYLGITVVIIIFHITAVFGSSILSQTKYGNVFFYIGGVVGAIGYFLLNKSKIKKSYISTIYIALFLLSLAFFYIPSLDNLSSFILGISNTFLFALPYYCNLVFKNTNSRFIYLIFNIVGVLQVAVMDVLLNLTNNNITILITIYFITATLALCLMFILNSSINNKIDNMLRLEKKDALFKDLSALEIKVAELLIKKYTNGAIAKEIYSSPNTIKFHIKNIYKKLNISSRNELISLVEK